MAHPTTSSTSPPTQNTSGVNTSHTLMSQGKDVSPAVSRACYCGFVIRRRSLTLLDNFIALQGTKVLEDREVRFLLCYISEGAPQREASSSVFKYTGALSTPQWMDTELGSVFVSITLLGGSSRAEKFETLCDIQADISTAPYETKRGNSGTVYYTRNFTVILLVGLTELKAQIGWIDSTTVSPQRIISYHPF